MQSVCVFAGSSLGADPRFHEAAIELGTAIGSRGMTMVYGGARVGLMGAAADAALAHGAAVIGVLPQFLAGKEIAHSGLTELHIVQSMHERKAMMAARSDAFVALPGGVGTMEEFFEVLTWGQLGLHAKPCGLLNVAGFYDPLLAFLDGAVDQRLLKPAHRDLVTTAETVTALLERLSARQSAPAEPKWPVGPVGPAGPAGIDASRT
jgi:uncharacterized protein (TIGR00730 family)